MLIAMLEHAGSVLPILIRNLSAHGAMVEGDVLPAEGSEVVFKRNDLTVQAHVAWVKGNIAGLAFAESLSADAVLRHISMPNPPATADFKRPGVGTRRLTAEERAIGETWASSENRSKD